MCLFTLPDTQFYYCLTAGTTYFHKTFLVPEPREGVVGLAAWATGEEL